MLALIVAVTILIAALFRGITGFGYALIAAIGLAAILPQQSAVPLILINDLVLTVLILANRKHGAVDWIVTPMLLLTGFAGALCGSILANHLDEPTAKLLVAISVFIAALAAMVHQPPKWLGHRVLGLGAGFTVGILLAAFAVGGPLIAVWLLAGGTKRETARGTLAVFFGAVDLFSLASRAALGQIDAGLVQLLFIYLPLTLAGYAVGAYVGPRLNHLTWRRVSALGLLAIAVSSAAQTVLNLIAVN